MFDISVAYTQTIRDHRRGEDLRSPPERLLRDGMNSSPGAPSVPGLMQITALTQMLYSRQLPGIRPHQCSDDDGDAIAVIHKMRNTHGDTPVTLGAGRRRGVRQFNVYEYCLS